MDDNQKPIPDFAILKLFAETASGVRGCGDHDRVWLVYDPDPQPPYEPYANKVRVTRSDPPTHVSDRAVMLQVSSKSTNPDPRGPDLAQIGRDGRVINLLDLGGRPGINPPIAADAVFWTESAVEKFLVPYYAAVHGPNAARRVKAVLKVLHRPKDDDGADEEELERAFALIHLPTSEYVDDTTPVEGVEPQADEFYIARVGGADGRAELVSLDAWAERKTRAEV